jgi:60 kDa SS-A/Ro ribonucleoprotein
MARFNVQSKYTQTEKNFEGDVAFKISPEMELYSIACASMLQPTFYVPNTNDQLNKIKSLIKKVDPFFVAQLAIYVRERMYLRTIPLVLTVELAKIQSGSNLIRRLTKRVVQRADEITELMAYYVKANQHAPKHREMKGGHVVEKKLYKLSNQIRKGLADVFESGKFDEYQYAKYNRATEIKLRDILFLTHPKPRDTEMEVLFGKIANNNLDTPYTWETELSKAGQDGKSKKAVWEDLILSGKLGYMALLRNLRNILKEEVSDILVDKVAGRIGDPKEVRYSKQLPFRFLSAYRMLGGDPHMHRGGWNTGDDDYQDVPNKLFQPDIMKALEKAVLTSVENMPVFENENVLIATDVSSSMWTPISERSVINQYDIGALLAMLAQTRCENAVVGMFGDSWKVLDDLPMDNVLQATNEIYKREGEVGYSTNGYKVLEWALEHGEEFDRIMMFTDGQLWDSYGSGRDEYGFGVSARFGKMNKLWKEYKKEVPQAKLYLFNLSSYGQSPLDLRGDDVYLISGWSDKIFNVLANLEKGGEALDEIKDIEF